MMDLNDGDEQRMNDLIYGGHQPSMSGLSVSFVKKTMCSGTISVRVERLLVSGKCRSNINVTDEGVCTGSRIDIQGPKHK